MLPDTAKGEGTGLLDLLHRHGEKKSMHDPIFRDLQVQDQSGN